MFEIAVYVQDRRFKVRDDISIRGSHKTLRLVTVLAPRGSHVAPVLCPELSGVFRGSSCPLRNANLHRINTVLLGTPSELARSQDGVS